MTYEEFRKQEQREFEALPIFFAFSDEQFEQQMNARGLTINDVDKVYKLGAGFGGYYLKKDAQIIRDFYNKPDKLGELMQDADFAESAFFYEMGNHEYHINWQGDWDVLSCFGMIDYVDADDEVEQYFEQLGFTDVQRKAYIRARRKFLRFADENDWY